MKIRYRLAGLLLAVLMAGASAQAQTTNWWDKNGVTAGSGAGAANGSGTWGVDTYWTTNPAGTSATTAWTPGAVAAFSAGTDGTNGTFTVTVSGTQDVNGILKEEGANNRPVFSGGILNFVGANPFIQGQVGLQGDNVIQGTNTLTLGGGGAFQVATVDSLKNAPGGQLSIRIKDNESWNWRVTNTSYTGGTTLGAGSTITWGANPLTTGTAIQKMTNPDNGIVDAFGDGAITMEAGSAFSGRGPSGSVSNSWRTVTNAFTLNGDVAITAADGISPSNGFNSLTLSGPVTLTADRKISVNAVDNIGTYRSNTTVIAGAIVGNHKLTKAGVGLLVLSGDNTFNGGIAVDAGTVMAGKTNTFNGNAVDFTSAFNTTKIVALNGFSQTIGGLSGAGTNGLSKLVNGLANNPSAALATLTVSNSATSVYGGKIGGGNANERNLNVVFTGAGVQALTGTNDYTGTTLVTGGSTLVINGNNSSAINTLTIDTGSTLMGTGIIGGATTVNGMLKPGNSPGTLNFDAALTLGSASTSQFEIVSASSFDVLKNDGGDTITFNSGATVIFDFTGNTTVSNGSSFAVLQNWNSVVTNGAVFSVVGLTDPDLSVDYSTLVSNGTITVIPEPATIGMLGLGALITIMIRRMRTA